MSNYNRCVCKFSREHLHIISIKSLLSLSIAQLILIVPGIVLDKPPPHGGSEAPLSPNSMGYPLGYFHHFDISMMQINYLYVPDHADIGHY